MKRNEYIRKLKDSITSEGDATKCVFCTYQYAKSSSGKPDKIERHLFGRKCVADNPNMKKRFLEEIAVYNDTSQSSSSNTSSSALLSEDSNPSPTKVQRVTSQDDDMKSLFMEKLATFIFSSGLPMSIIESPVLLEALQLLNPHVQLPCRKTLADTYIDFVFNKQKAADQDLLNATYRNCGGVKGTLMCDVWTNTTHQSVLSFVYVSPALPKPMYIESVFSGVLSIDRFFVEKETKRVIASIGEDRVVCVSTDNAEVMAQAKLILQAEYPNIRIPGCICHWIALIPGDLVKNSDIVRGTLESASHLCRYFNSHHSANALLKHYKPSGALQQSCTTRWFSNVTMLQSIQDNWEALLKTVGDSRFMRRCSVGENSLVELSSTQRNDAIQIKQLIEQNGQFFPNILFLLKLLQPLKEIERKFDQNYPLIQDIYPDLVGYAKTVGSYTQGESDFATIAKILKNILKHRFKIIEEEPIYLQAHLLDPFRLGNAIENDAAYPYDISGTQERMANFFQESKDKDLFYNQLARYILDANRYTESFKQSIKSIHLVHFFYQRSSQYPLLCKFAISLFSSIPTTCAVERHFSNYGFIHRLDRNRLGCQRSAKLVYIYQRYAPFSNDDDNDEILDNQNNYINQSGSLILSSQGVYFDKADERRNSHETG